MDIKKECSELLKKNRRTERGNTFTLPSATSYPYQWMWDSCFHAIVLRHIEPAVAKKEIKSLLQYQWNNGKIPHMIYWDDTKRVCREAWGTTMPTSSITQPPMIAYAVLKVYESTKDKDFVKEVFKPIDKYYRWLGYVRDPDRDYLLSIIHPWESGEDNSINWDYVMGFKREPSEKEIKKKKKFFVTKYRGCYFDDRYYLKKNHFNSKNIFFNCIYMKNLQSMARLSLIAGNMKKRRYYLKKYIRVRKAIRDNLYNDKTMTFRNIYGKRRKILDRTADKFMFLFAQLLKKNEAKALVDKMLTSQKKFWTKFPVPTAPKGSVRFSPTKYWRGTVWININWFIVIGLLQYGYFKLAKELTEKSIDLVKKSGFREYYNPNNGDGLGAKDFSWTTLILDMLKELEKYESREEKSLKTMEHFF